MEMNRVSTSGLGLATATIFTSRVHFSHENLAPLAAKFGNFDFYHVPYASVGEPNRERISLDRTVSLTPFTDMNPTTRQISRFEVRDPARLTSRRHLANYSVCSGCRGVVTRGGKREGASMPPPELVFERGTVKPRRPRFGPLSGLTCRKEAGLAPFIWTDAVT